MFSNFVESLWGRGAVTLMSVANLLAAPSAPAEVKNWASAFHDLLNDVNGHQVTVDIVAW